MLEDRDGEGVLVEVDLGRKSEGEEGLGHGAVIKRLVKAMVELRVDVLLIVIFNADTGPRKVLQVIVQFNEEHAVIAVYKATLLLESGGPQGRLVRPITLPFTTTPWIP